MTKFQENLQQSPSLSNDEEGWSTGSGSSSSGSGNSSSYTFETMDFETSLDQDDIEEDSFEEYSESQRLSGGNAHRNMIVNIEESTRSGASYDDIEDFSEWVSDSEIGIPKKGNLLMPNLGEKSTGDDNFFGRTPNSTGHQRSMEYDSHFESEVSFSDSPDPVSSSARDSSYAASKETSESSSNLFVLSSSSVYSSESRDQTIGVSPNSTTSHGTSSAAGRALSSSIASADSNQRSGNKNRRQRRRRPRTLQKSSNLVATSSTKISSTSPGTPKHRKGSIHSESTEPRTPSSTNTPRSKREQRSRKSSSSRSKMSPQKFKSTLAEIAEILKEPSPVPEKSTGNLKSTMKSSPKPKTSPKVTSKSPRSSPRSRQQVRKESPSASQNESFHATGSGTKTSSNLSDHPLSRLEYSKSVSFLKDFDCGLKTTSKRIHATINNEGYQTFVKKAYYKLLKSRPRLKYLLSLSEWLHIHMLLLYARIFECELHFYGIILPREFRIAVPDKTMVFEPIAAVISSIGIVEEPDNGITYIPVARYYRADDVYKPHNKDDVTEFLEWTQYDWNASWYQAEKERLERRMMAAEKNMNIPHPETSFDESILEDWQQLVVAKWLGWDDDLWFSYMQACFVLDNVGQFVSFPRDGSKRGSYAWLLARQTNDKGAFVRIPRPSLSHESWMIALMLDFCALDPSVTGTWYHETNTVGNVPDLINSFLDAAMANTSTADTANSTKEE